MLIIIALKACIGGGDSAKVSNIFSEGKFSLHKNVRQRLVGVKLFCQTFSFLLEARQVLLSEPVLQISFRIELRTLVIKAV